MPGILANNLIGTANGILKANGSGVVSAATAGTDYRAVSPMVPQGRLTTESGIAVSSSDRTAQSTIYFTPYLGSRVTLYSGSIWKEYAYTERSLALSSLTSGKNYDVFLYDNSGTLTLELSSAWSSDSARTNALTTQDGFLVKSGATTRLYLGTIRTTGTTTTEDSGGGSTTQVGGKRFVWNYYNRIRRALSVIDTTDSWNYTTNTIRQANGATGNKVEWVCGDTITAEGHVLANWQGHSNSSNAAKAGIGYDTITAFTGIVAAGYVLSASAQFLPLNGSCVVTSVAGYHYLSWNEKGGDVNSTFNGDNVGDGEQSGLTATIEN